MYWMRSCIMSYELPVLLLAWIALCKWRPGRPRPGWRTTGLHQELVPPPSADEAARRSMYAFGLVHASLSVHLTQHDVERADNSDDVSHQLSAAHHVKRLQIHERRWPHPNAIGL